MPDLAGQLTKSLAPIDERLNRIEAAISEQDLSTEQLNRLRAELEGLDDDVLGRVIELQPELSDLKARLQRLPDPPKEGDPAEPQEIANERQALSDASAKATLAMRDAELMAVRAGNLLDRVLSQRRELFVSRLFERRFIDSQTVTVTMDEAGRYAALVVSSISGWIRSLFEFNLLRLLAALALTAIVGVLLSIMLRPLRRWLQHVLATDRISYLQQVTLAFFTIILPTAAAAIWALSLHLFLTQLGLYRFRVDEIVPVVLGVLVAAVFFWLLLRAVLSPGDESRRLIALSGSAARRLTWLGMAMALVAGLDYALTQLVIIFDMPVEFTVVKSVISALLLALLMVLVVRTRLQPVGAESPRSGYRGWNPIIYWLVWASVFAIVIAIVAGFVSLGRFMAGQIIFTGSIAATLYIGYLASRAIATQGAMATTRFGARLVQERGFSELRLDQIGLLASILINIMLLMIGIPVVLLQFGFEWSDVLRWGGSLLFGFSVGGVQISLGRIAFALLVFFLLIAATRMVQRWFDGKILARTQLDAGVKNSVRAGVGYVGFFIAAMIGISWAGFNLSNIALIAGALSVGIGFGLQNIVNNFVSGIIMLIERPIKVGDIIVVAGAEGFVRKINVRATELETFDRQSVIIPNSEVINTSVGNWMHTDSVRRVVIAIGVAYGSDIEKVRNVLLETVEGDDRIATFPHPFVHFADFGASSLDFQLRFFLRDIMETPFVETDVRFRIDKAFRENGIEIPFPQTDLHIRSGLKEALQDDASRANR
ncbi:MAG: mechanosensitive ion channel [Ahrensia sp.]|nr:mechanosensitive ion channel [Ahrensia sp.]